MATDAASGWILDKLEDGKPASKVSPLENIIPEPGKSVSIRILDMDTYTEKAENPASEDMIFTNEELDKFHVLGKSCCFPK